MPTPRHADPSPPLALALVLALAPACDADNTPPQIEDLYADAPVVNISGTVDLHARATDGDGDPLQYLWTTSACGIAGSGADVTFDTLDGSTEPCHAGEAAIELTVLDGRGGEDTDRIYLTVELDP